MNVGKYTLMSHPTWYRPQKREAGHTGRTDGKQSQTRKGREGKGREGHARGERIRHACLVE